MWKRLDAATKELRHWTSTGGGVWAAVAPRGRPCSTPTSPSSPCPTTRSTPRECSGPRATVRLGVRHPPRNPPDPRQPVPAATGRRHDRSRWRPCSRCPPRRRDGHRLVAPRPARVAAEMAERSSACCARTPTAWRRACRTRGSVADMQPPGRCQRLEADPRSPDRDPNRKVLTIERTRPTRKGRRSTARQVGLLMLDLDHFKEINDTLGHHAGDAVLCAVASGSTAMRRPEDVVARLGGDEFAILLATSRDRPREPSRRAEAARGALRAVRTRRISTSRSARSIGIACYPDDGSTAEDLLRCADMAMYQAKQARGYGRALRSDLDDHTAADRAGRRSCARRIDERAVLGAVPATGRPADR